ncbi:PKD domain-containing protein, partial [bacterium]|nr:PKD domain-containing protein [bacterium]
FQYYGNPGDNEIRVSIACNEAYNWAVAAIGSNPDLTGPSVWTPQRYPYNPGGKSFGPQTGYVLKDMPRDFHVWTFAYDRGGITDIRTVFRTDKDGANSTANNHNETFAGGTDVNPWQSQAMTDRGEFPRTMDGFGGLENIQYELPTVIAHHYWTRITAETNTLYDYFIVATDAAGHSTTSDIQHVYVGASTAGGDAVVAYSPDPPVQGAECTISYDSAGRVLSGASGVNMHYGANNWNPVIAPDAAMTGTTGGVWACTVFVSSTWSQIDCVFNNGAGTWDNNGGADWHRATVAGDQPPVASFTAYPRAGDAPLAVSFTDTSFGQVLWREWSFGDGNVSAAQNPVNLYPDPGAYAVQLIVSNAFGASTNMKHGYIVVSSALVSNADGTNIVADNAGAQRILQDTPTGFGDAVTPGHAGSELDALYMTNSLDCLRISISGNLETNGNCVMLFIDSTPGGTNRFGTAYSCERVRSLNGLVLDAGFAPDFAIVINAWAAGFFLDFEELGGAAKDGYFGTGAGSIFVSRVLEHANTGLRAGFNDSNVGGITSSSTNGAASVTTGWEFDIPWSLIDVGLPTACVVKVQAIITGPMIESSAGTKWLSNQSLPGVNNATNIQGQIGGGSIANYDAVPGAQHASYAFEAIPEPAALACALLLVPACARRAARASCQVGASGTSTVKMTAAA